MKVLLLLWSALLLSIATAAQPPADSLLPMTTGFAPIDGPVYATGSLENGRMILGGDFRTVNGQVSRNVAFLEEDGTPVAGFSVQLNGRVLAVETERNEEGGGFYIAGEFTQVNGVNVGRLARFHADGTFDIGFNANLSPGFNNTVCALRLARTTVFLIRARRLMAAGDFTSLSGVPQNRLSLIELTGVPNVGWSTGANGPIHALAVDSLDRIVLGGQFTELVNSGGFLPSANVDRILSTGDFDFTFNPGTGPEGPVYAVAIDPRDDRIVIGGQFPSYRGTPVANHLRINTDGSADPSYNSAGTFIPPGDTVRALSVLADGRVLLGKDRIPSAAPWCLGLFPATGGFEIYGYLRFGFGSESVRTITRTASGAHLAGGNFHFTYESRNFVRISESGTEVNAIYQATSANNTITEAAMGDDGSIFVIGEFTRLFGVDRRYVAKLTPEGRVDMTFVAPWLDRRPIGIAVEGGQVLLGGDFHTSRGSPASCLIRVDAVTGVRDPTLVLDVALSTAGDTVSEIEVFGGGYVLVQQPGVLLARLTRVDHNGAVVPGFAAPALGIGLLTNVYNSRRIVTTADRILVFYGGGLETRIARLLPSGLEDPDYSAISCDSFCTMMVPGLDGFIYVAGRFANVGAGSRDRIARLQPGTHTLDGWKPALQGPHVPGALHARTDGTLTVGYDATVFGTGILPDEVRQIERLLPDGVSDPGQKFIRPNGIRGVASNILVPVSRPEWSGPAFLLGGNFSNFDNQPVSNAAFFDADDDFVILNDPPRSGLNGPVSALLPQPGRLFAAGEFFQVQNNSAASLAVLQTDLGWRNDPTVRARVHGFGLLTGKALTAVPTTQDVLLAGSFPTCTDGLASEVQSWNADICRLDERQRVRTAWNVSSGTWDGAAGGEIRTVVPLPDGMFLAGGNFRNFGGLPNPDYTVGPARDNLVLLNVDGTLNGAFSLGANDPVHALLVDATGGVIVGGEYNLLDGHERTGLARLKIQAGTWTVDPAWNVTLSGGGIVRSLALTPEGNVVIAGDFNSVNGTSHQNLSCLLPNGHVLPGFNPFPGFNGPVLSVAVQPNGGILAGGRFSMAGGFIQPYLARLRPDGRLDSSFRPVLDGAVRTIAIAPPGMAGHTAGDVYIGGEFVSVNGEARAYIAALAGGSLPLEITAFSHDVFSAIIDLCGSPVRSYRCEYSSNLVNWTTLTDFITGPDGSIRLFDNAYPVTRRRFYRFFER